MTNAVVPAPSAPLVPTDRPLGQPRGLGRILFLSLFTCGVYFFYWIYKSFEELRNYRRAGMNPVVGLALSFVGIGQLFLPATVKSSYRAVGKRSPVSAWTGLWAIGAVAPYIGLGIFYPKTLPILWVFAVAGIFVWIWKTQKALNTFWELQGAEVPESVLRRRAAAASSMPARLMTAFSGTNGLIAKVVLLSIFNALVVWACTVLVTHHKWIALLVTAAAALAIDLIYLVPSKRTLPLKFLVPGTVFLIAFTVIPIVYTVNIAFTNYSTGHILSKSEAIDQIKLRSLSQPKNGKTYTLSPALDKNGKLTLLLVDDQTHKPYVGTKEALTPLSPSDVTIKSGAITQANGFKVLTGPALFTLDTQLNDFRVPLGDGTAIHPEGADYAVQLKPDKIYDPKTDTFTSVRNGTVYRDNGAGSFAAPGAKLEPGWKTYNGLKQFSNIVTNPLYRRPFLRVLLWTIVFAASTVILSFALGLFLAVVLQKKFRGQKFYRAMLVIPYAVPSSFTILVWAGLLNDDFGIVNKLFHIHVSWLFDPWWARVSVILVSLWLSFPYFFLVCLGALQSIPGDLVEAAKVDGAGGIQVFRRITFPLLLVSTAPLMIASFAFNFNNFNNIYLLTGGGPSTNDQSVAGATDILISYTYKLAFSAGQGQQYSTAAAVSIIIFLIVATISGILFWRTKALESLR